jgi:hypothetical protein
MAVDLTQEMRKVYEAGKQEIDKLEEQIKKKKDEIRGATAYLTAIGEIEKPVGAKRGRKPKTEETPPTT